MSRFIEVLNAHRGEVTMRTFTVILEELKNRLDAETAHIEVEFPYFVEREAPVSKSKALMDYECTFIGESNGKYDDFILRVRTPVLCTGQNGGCQIICASFLKMDKVELRPLSNDYLTFSNVSPFARTL